MVDVFTPPQQCWATLPALGSLIVFTGFLVLVFRIVRFVTRMQQLWRVKFYCENVLNLPSSGAELEDVAWYIVQKNLIKAQREFQFSPQKQYLDELDIYNRILRKENYLIALINQYAIPVKFQLPRLISFTGFSIYLPNIYLWNLELLFFYSPWAPFVHQHQLHNDYKWITKRERLAKNFANMSMILGLINLALLPFIFIIQILIFLCSNAEKIRYEPHTFFGRSWSNYAHYILRHYNELPHEFSNRLTSAHFHASKYLDAFSSQLAVVTATNVRMLAGGVSFLMLAINLVCDDFIHLPGWLAIAIGAGMLARVCSKVG
ncbi:Autophagy- protein 9A [Cichlidogyrus casuarinus]|uniref:Autophagy-related protein 9 n=1 Tax=Cichlidogyrus casuarinus TaxID=1844966 RepID=A0ABD2QMM1_9PLAT